MTIHTSLLTPTHIFQKEQQLLVPLFQRPYTWNKKEQWDPLWTDVTRVASRLLSGSGNIARPHFLGAIVLQQLPSNSGDLEYRSVIDGQQRLTTLQILLDSVHAELTRQGLTSQAAKLIGLIENGEVFRNGVDDNRFKIWPTNLDRSSFRAVMSAESPIDYSVIPNDFHASKFYQGHKFFAEETKVWLEEGSSETLTARADALVKTLRDQLQLVVIDLDTADDAQEIFETLNARGARLESSDLVKNFVFQKLIEEGVNVEAFYKDYWFKFETRFWVETISVGREKFQRSSLFLYHWIVSKTATDLVEREVFSRFKEFALDSGLKMSEIVAELSESADIYQEKIIQAGDHLEGNLDRLGLFIYRTNVMDTSVVRPLLLELFDPRKAPVSEDQTLKFINVIESWLVRRLLARATSKGYNRIFVDALVEMKRDRANCGDRLEAHFARQSNYSSYWPDDQELRGNLANLPFYLKIGKGRQRMLLEAIEDYFRGWIGTSESAAGTRVKRSTFEIEHVMPQSWTANWPLPPSISARDRDDAVQKLGNLSLLTRKLNGEVSNRGWIGTSQKDGKRHFVEESDLLLLNRKLLVLAENDWTEEKIAERTSTLIEAILAIWEVPDGHAVSFNTPKVEEQVYVVIADLLEFGSLQAGQILYPNQKEHGGKTAEVLLDGRIAVDQEIFFTPSGAAEYARKQRTNGWKYWLVDKEKGASLSDIRATYREALAIDSDDSESEPETEEPI